MPAKQLELPRIAGITIRTIPKYNNHIESCIYIYRIMIGNGTSSHSM